LTGKGPDMYIAPRGQMGPTRNTWSNWTDFDNLGYRDEDQRYRGDLFQGGIWGTDKRARGRVYDFRTRRYVNSWKPNIWSDAKWEPGHKPKLAWYFRNKDGFEFTLRNGLIDTENFVHDFEYNEDRPYWDWMVPNSNDFWQYAAGW
jgi:hypothetical protein